MLLFEGKRPLRVAVIGSRTFTNYELAEPYLKELSRRVGISLVSGGATGADSFAERFAKDNGLKVRVIKPDWSLGKGAGLIRNTEIIEACDVVLAFWDEKSRGTLDSLNKAKLLNKPAFIICLDGGYYQY